MRKEGGNNKNVIEVEKGYGQIIDKITIQNGQVAFRKALGQYFIHFFPFILSRCWKNCCPVLFQNRIFYLLLLCCRVACPPFISHSFVTSFSQLSRRIHVFTEIMVKTNILHYIPFFIATWSNFDELALIQQNLMASKLKKIERFMLSYVLPPAQKLDRFIGKVDLKTCSQSLPRRSIRDLRISSFSFHDLSKPFETKVSIYVWTLSVLFSLSVLFGSVWNLYRCAFEYEISWWNWNSILMSNHQGSSFENEKNGKINEEKFFHEKNYIIEATP